MSIVTPDDTNRKERMRVVSIDCETIPDPDWLEYKAGDLEPFDLDRYLGKMQRGEMNTLATTWGIDPKPFKNMGDMRAELLRVAPTLDEGDAGYPELIGLYDRHNADQGDGLMRSAVQYRAMASQIVAVGCVSYYGGAEDPDPDRTFSVAGDNEGELIRSIFQHVEEADIVTGFNLYGFDQPMLRWRACLLGINLPAKLWKFRRYSDWPLCDTMFELGNWEPSPRGTLEDWAWRFGVEPPAKTDFREIIMWYQAGDWNALRAHVLQDAQSAGALYHRISPALHLPG
jgi:hypothetical protein